MKTKALLTAILIVLVLGISAAAFWWLRRPQVLTFSDDAKLTLLGVDYGKHHVPPTMKASSGSTNRAATRSRGGSFNTTNDTLVVWVRQEYDSKQWHNFQYYVYDKAGAACVQTYPRNFGNGRQGNEVVAVEFDAFPRHEGKLYLLVQENANNGIQETAEKKFIIRNPARGPFAKWTPETLPSTKTDDDFSATLTKLAAGAQMPYNRGDTDPDDAMNKGVQASFHVERNGKPVTNWQPVSVATSDATGNHVSWGAPNWGNQNNSPGGWANGDGTITYQYGLWPDEPAWKIRVEFSQQSDFADNESWTVPNVPLQPGRQQEMWNYGGRRQAQTNAPFAETDLNGFHLKIFPGKQFTDVGPNSNPQGGLFIQVSPDITEGFRMTVKITDDQTNDIQHWEYGNNRANNVTVYRYGLQDISGLTNLTVSVALHKSRYVEFTAKPETAPAAAETAQ